MKYVARPVEDDDNANVSSDSGFSYAARIMLRVVLGVLAVYLILGLLVDFAVPYIPATWEDALARPVMNEISSGKKIAEEYNLGEIQKLLDSLAALIEGNERKFVVNVFVENESNALALPGGNIVIYSELLEQAESENELAMILAHELGHFVARDHLRGLGRSFLLFAVTTLFFGADDSSTKALINSSGILQNNYSRAQEYAADAFALQLLNKKYGHIGGALDFFRRLASKEILPNLIHYLSTHPASEKRVKVLAEIIAGANLKTAEVKPVFWSQKKLQAEQN